MGIKLSDYIKDPSQALSEEDWITIYTHALKANVEFDENLAEELMEASNEALETEIED